MPLGDKDELNALLSRAGIEQSTVQAVLELDALMQKWRRRAMKRELGHRALIDLRIGLELAQLDVLLAIEGRDPHSEEAPGETMVATVAERLNIDPSRASRMVSEMVEMGYARRAVSQADARRTIIELTPSGRAVVDAVRAYKFLIMGDFLGQWDGAELAAFVPMLRRFGSWMDGVETASETHAAEIAAIAESIARSLPVGEPA